MSVSFASLVPLSAQRGKALTVGLEIARRMTHWEDLRTISRAYRACTCMCDVSRDERYLMFDSPYIYHSLFFHVTHSLLFFFYHLVRHHLLLLFWKDQNVRLVNIGGWGVIVYLGLLRVTVPPASRKPRINHRAPLQSFLVPFRCE